MRRTESLRGVLPIAMLNTSFALLACSEPTTAEKCTEFCEKALNECGAELPCGETCAPFDEPDEPCRAEADRFYDCALDIIDDFSHDELCVDDGSNASLFARCDAVSEDFSSCQGR